MNRGSAVVDTLADGVGETPFNEAPIHESGKYDQLSRPIEPWHILQ